MYDIAIIGGGPAGATLARLTGNKYKILLLEKRVFHGPLYKTRQKCCGGLLDPDAQKMLAVFGLGLPKSVILSPQLFAVRTLDMDNSIERYYQRHYVNIDREEFDKWLGSLIPKNVDVKTNCIFLSHDELSDHVSLKYLQNGKTFHAQTKLLIGADGAFSKVRRIAFQKRESPRKYFAIQEWFETRRRINYYGAFFDREVTDFYSWAIPKENSIIIGSALDPDEKPLDKFEVLKTKLTKYGFDIGKSIQRNGAYVLRPKSRKEIILGSGRIGLVGEAAGFISPSSAEGISYAFRSALALSKAILWDFEGWEKQYEKNSQGLCTNIVLKNMKAPFMYNKALRKIVMRSGIKSIDTI